MAELAAKHPARSATAKRQRLEQMKRWKEDDTSKASSQPRTERRENRVKFEEGVIFLAATASDDEDEVRRLLKEGSDVNFANVDGLTALHQCCIGDNEDMIRLLLNEGANIDRMDNEGWTPLHAAASSGNLSIVKLLVEKGANIALANNEGELPLDLAEDEDVKEYLETVIEMQGIDAEQARNAEEWMMLEDAEKLLEDGQSMSEGTGGATALHVACAKGYLHVINLLLQAGVDINCRDRDGWTPLHACAHWGQLTAAEMLATAGARFDIMTYAGESSEDLMESDEQREKLIGLRLRSEGVRKSGTFGRNKSGDVFEAMQRIRTDSMMKRRTSISRLKKDLAGKRDISQERNIQESFHDGKPSNEAALIDKPTTAEQSWKETGSKHSPALLRRNGSERAVHNKEADGTNSARPLGSGASKAIANLLNSPIGFTKFHPRSDEERLLSGTESSPVLPWKPVGAADDLDNVSADNRLKNAGSTPKFPAMSTSTGVFRTGDNLDSQIAESPSVVRPRSSDGEATVMEAGAGAKEMEGSMPVVSPSRSGVNEENEKLPEAKRRDKAKQKRQKRRPTQPVSTSDVMEAKESLEGPENEEESIPPTSDSAPYEEPQSVESTPKESHPEESYHEVFHVEKGKHEGVEEPVSAPPPKQRTSEMMRRKKARKSREDRPQTGGGELFQAIKDAANAGMEVGMAISQGDDRDKVEDEEQEKEEEVHDVPIVERSVTPRQSAFKPRARPKPKVFVDEPKEEQEGGSSERREPEGSSGDSSSSLTKQGGEKVSDLVKRPVSNQPLPRRQPRRYIAKGPDGATQRRETGYVWDTKLLDNQNEETGNVTDDRVVNSEQKEAEAKKKTVVTRTVTRKYLKKPRRSTGPVDLEELKDSTPALESNNLVKEGMTERTGGDGVNGSATAVPGSSSSLMPRVAENIHQGSSSPEGTDYKLLFEEEKEKHQRLKAKYLQAQVDIKDQQTQLKQAIDKIEEIRLKYENERRERKSLEARLQDIEIASSETSDASKQIAKLKDENAALIRVIGKLSRSTPS